MILPQPRTQFLDSLARPLVGGSVYTYAQGTTTPKLTYQDSALSVVNTNPILLDGAGSAAIWGTGAYTFSVRNSVGALIYSGDTIGWDFNATNVAITGGAINGTPIGQTTAAAGKFTALTITGGIDGTNLGLVTPAQGKFTTIDASGQVTFPAGVTSGAGVNLGQVANTHSISANNSGTGTTLSATTASFTAPSKGNLSIEAFGMTDTAAQINGATLATSLAGMVPQAGGFLGMSAFRFAYLPMNTGDVTTATATLTAASSVGLFVGLRIIFQPTP